MALFKSKKKKEEKTTSENNNENIQKLVVFVTIVNHGLADPVAKLFQNAGSNVQFIERGNGTASKEIRDILGIEDTAKDLIFSIIREDKAKEIKPDLLAFFKANKYNKGIGFTIPMTSIIGVKLYQFLTDAQ